MAPLILPSGFDLSKTSPFGGEELQRGPTATLQQASSLHHCCNVVIVDESLWPKILRPLRPREPAAQRYSARRPTRLYASAAGADPSGDGLPNPLEVCKAAVEVASERLPSALADGTASLARLEAEQRRAVEQFGADVLARARRQGGTGAAVAAGTAAAAAAGGSSGASGGGGAGAPDLAEALDGLRADVAAARAVLQAVRRQQQEGKKKRQR
eukprot:scaffold3.g6528.t1